MELFDPSKIKLTKYLFYTGKGGVGKTSVAAAFTLGLAKRGKKFTLLRQTPQLT